MKPGDAIVVRISREDAERLPSMLWAVIDAVDGEVDELPDGTMDTIDRLALTIHTLLKGSTNERAD